MNWLKNKDQREEEQRMNPSLDSNYKTFKLKVPFTIPKRASSVERSPHYQSTSIKIDEYEILTKPVPQYAWIKPIKIYDIWTFLYSEIISHENYRLP